MSGFTASLRREENGNIYFKELEKNAALKWIAEDLNNEVVVFIAACWTL